MNFQEVTVTLIKYKKSATPKNAIIMTLLDIMIHSTISEIILKHGQYHYRFIDRTVRRFSRRQFILDLFTNCHDYADYDVVVQAADAFLGLVTVEE